VHALLAIWALASCTERGAATAHPRLGSLMTEVGRRFELLGRAATARRWELAEFELGELRETFDDVPRAVMPDDVKADVPTLARTFVPVIEDALAGAVATHDLAQLEPAFAAAADACNKCHQAAGKAFIEVPARPGQPVPRLDPAP